MGGPPGGFPPMMNPDYVPCELPKNQFVIVIISLMIALIMASLDITIVSCALPIISKQFHAFNNYTWVIVSYLLAQTVIQPTTGKLADIFGRRPAMLFMIIIFIISSAACGASKSFNMLIIARAFQGIGGGSIISMVNIIITDIVSLRKRATYMAIVNSVFSLSAIVGPLIGGLFVDTISWRWAFYINVPICIVAAILISLFVKIPTPPGSFMEKFKKIDFLGTLFVIGFSICLLFGLNWGGTNYPWSHPIIIGLLVGFVIFLGLFILVECKFAKEPIIPPNLFHQRNVIISAIGTFVVGFIFITFNNTIPMLYQNARGFLATDAGLRLTPCFVTLAVASIVSGILTGKFGHIKIHIIVGTISLAAATYLITLIKLDTVYWIELIIILLYGFGVGMANQNFLVIGQNAVPKPLIATATSTILFGRTVGGVIGVAIFGTLLKNNFIQNYFELHPEKGHVNMNSLSSLSDFNEPYMEALSMSYRVTIFPAAVIALLIAFLIKKMAPMGPPGGPMGPGGPMKGKMPQMQVISDQTTLHDNSSYNTLLDSRSYNPLLDKASYSNDQVTLNDNVIDIEKLEKCNNEQKIKNDIDTDSEKDNIDKKTVNDSVINIEKIEQSKQEEPSKQEEQNKKEQLIINIDSEKKTVEVEEVEKESKN